MRIIKKGYYEFDKLEDGNFKILACFTRSFDENHKQKEMIHLITSVVLCRYFIDYKMVANYIQDNITLYRSFGYSSLYSKFYDKKFYIFDVIETQEDSLDIKKPYCITEIGP
jgi:hypothetical protein